MRRVTTHDSSPCSFTPSPHTLITDGIHRINEKSTQSYLHSCDRGLAMIPPPRTTTLLPYHSNSNLRVMGVSEHLNCALENTFPMHPLDSASDVRNQQLLSEVAPPSLPPVSSRAWTPPSRLSTESSLSLPPTGRAPLRHEFPVQTRIPGHHAQSHAGRRAQEKSLRNGVAEILQERSVVCDGGGWRMWRGPPSGGKIRYIRSRARIGSVCPRTLTWSWFHPSWEGHHLVVLVGFRIRVKM